MSRIGKKVIAIPKGVKIDVKPGAVEVQGPKGKLLQALPPGIGFEVERRPAPGAGRCARIPSSASSTAWRAAWSPTPSRGVTEGFRKDLDIVGVGYRAEVKGKQVHFALGYSHPVVFDIPTGIDVAIDKQTHITVTGIDRQLVGQVAANIRRAAQARPLQAEGRPLHRRSAEEEGREDGGEVAPDR